MQQLRVIPNTALRAWFRCVVYEAEDNMHSFKECCFHYRYFNFCWSQADDGVNAKSTEDATSCDEFASESIKDQLTTPVKEAPTSSVGTSFKT